MFRMPTMIGRSSEIDPRPIDQQAAGGGGGGGGGEGGGRGRGGGGGATPGLWETRGIRVTRRRAQPVGCRG